MSHEINTRYVCAACVLCSISVFLLHISIFHYHSGSYCVSVRARYLRTLQHRAHIPYIHPNFIFALVNRSGISASSSLCFFAFVRLDCAPREECDFTEYENIIYTKYIYRNFHHSSSNLQSLSPFSSPFHNRRVLFEETKIYGILLPQKYALRKSGGTYGSQFRIQQCSKSLLL